MVDYNPYIHTSNAAWNNFDGVGTLQVSVFSSFYEMANVYPAVAFGSEVDLSNVSAVTDFITTNFTPRPVKHSAYSVNSVNETLAVVYTDLTDFTQTQAIDQNAQVRVLAQDVTGNVGMGEIVSEETITFTDLIVLPDSTAAARFLITNPTDNFGLVYDRTTSTIYWDFFETNARVNTALLGAQYEFEWGQYAEGVSSILNTLVLRAVGSFDNQPRSHVHLGWHWNNDAAYGIGYHGNQLRYGFSHTTTAFSGRVHNENIGNPQHYHYYRLTIVPPTTGSGAGINDIFMEVFNDAARTDKLFDAHMTETSYRAYGQNGSWSGFVKAADQNTELSIYVGFENGNSASYTSEIAFANFRYIEPEKPAFPAASTLNTSITSAAFDDTGNITLSGEVTASETEGATTSYKALATTQTGLSNTQVRDLINTSAYSEAVVDVDSFNINIDETTFPVTLDTVTDASDDKTPWVLALNYIHKGGTNPELNVRDTAKGFPVLPTGGSLDFNNVDINGTVPDGSVEHPDSWGHTGNDLFDKLCVALGSTSGNENGLEVRFVAKTNHIGSGFMHFKTNKQNLVEHFRYATGPQFVSEAWPASEYTLYDNHSAILPQNTDHFFELVGDYAMTRLPFFKSANGAHFGLRINDQYWNVDRAHTSSTNNTYHQIWVRANKQSGGSSISDVSIPKVLDANNQIVPAESVNYANVYLYGTDGVLAHDSMAVQTIDPMNLQEVRIMSDSVSTVVGTAFKTSIDGSSSILSGGSFQIFPESGDKIHFSSYYSTRTGMAMFDGIISVESGQNPDTHSWLGGNGVDPIYAVYEFSSGEKQVNSMDFAQNLNNNIAGVINIFYWDGSSFVEVNYTNSNELPITLGVYTKISFETVTSSQFKIQVNKHSTSSSGYVGMGEWRINGLVDKNNPLPTSHLPPRLGTTSKTKPWLTRAPPSSPVWLKLTPFIPPWRSRPTWT